MRYLTILYAYHLDKTLDLLNLKLGLVELLVVTIILVLQQPIFLKQTINLLLKRLCHQPIHIPTPHILSITLRRPQSTPLSFPPQRLSHVLLHRHLKLTAHNLHIHP